MISLSLQRVDLSITMYLLLFSRDIPTCKLDYIEYEEFDDRSSPSVSILII